MLRQFGICLIFILTYLFKKVQQVSVFSYPIFNDVLWIS